MSVKSNNLMISDPEYFHREYKNDFPQEDSGNYYFDQCKRITTVALPFLSLYKPLSFPLALTLGGLRSVTTLSEFLSQIQSGNLENASYAFLQTALALIALSGTILAHPLGMLVTTVHDCGMDFFALGQNLLIGDFQGALGSSANLINNTLYLALFTHGGLEIAIASLAMQTLIGLSHSASEYQKGNYLEAGGHFLMGMIRGNQLSGQIQTLQMKWEIENVLNKNFHQKKMTISDSSNAQQAKNDVFTSANFKMENSSDAIEANDLVELVGLPFNSPINDQSFYVHDWNIHGEAVGVAYFKSGTQVKEVAWYWSPVEKFAIIGSIDNLLGQSKEINAFYIPGIDIFQFNRFRINNSGVIVGSFVFQKKLDKTVDARYGWFTWSKENEIELGDFTKDHRYFVDLDEQNNVLINDVKLRSARVINISEKHKSEMFNYPPTDMGEMRNKIIAWFKSYYNKKSWGNMEWENLDIYSIYALSFNNNGSIACQGHGYFSFKGKGFSMESYGLNIDFNLGNTNFLPKIKRVCVLEKNGKWKEIFLEGQI